MSGNPEDELIRIFPMLRCSHFKVSSPYDPIYNCVAYVMGDTENWWEPDSMGTCYWPQGLPRGDYSPKAYSVLFETFGYKTDSSDQLEKGHNKIVIFEKNGIFKHVALQLESGLWTSKIGEYEDITHTLEGLVGDFYGQVKIVLKKQSIKIK